jgi:hypothetical protein
MKLPTNFNLLNEWESLIWKESKLSWSNQNKTYPLDSDSLPTSAGIYRITWDNPATWERLNHSLSVEASPQVVDPTLDFSDMKGRVCLTAGKSVNLRNRLKQHFGSNEFNNRCFKRLRSIAPASLTDYELLDLISKSVTIETCSIESWVLRDVFEAYAKATLMPIFDLRTER